MHIENGVVILGRRKCTWCDGTRRCNDWVTCTVCNGTGLVKRRRCPQCGNNNHDRHIRGKVVAVGIKECDSCTDGTQAETRYDAMPKAMWQSLTFRVYRSNRKQTYGEALLGEGVYSVTDYGRHKTLSDEEQFSEHAWHQACKVTDKECRICDHVGIFCNDMGYSVIAVFGKPEEVQDDLKAQLTEAEGIAVGMAMYHAGMNGTLGAAMVRKQKVGKKHD